MRPGGGKYKGHSFELKVAKLLSKWWGEDGSFQRTPLSGGWSKLSKATKDIADRVRGDLICPSEFPFFVECKCDESFDFHLILQGYSKSVFKNWWDVLVNKSIETSYKPMLIFSKNYWKIFVALDKKDYDKLHMRGHCKFIFCDNKDKKIVIFLLDDFLKQVLPDVVKGIE